MELTEAMRTTAACREFTPEPVDEDVLRRILDSARFAPSGGNRQPWRVVRIESPSLRKEIAHLYALSWREYWAHVERGLVPFAPDEDGRWHGPAIDLEAARDRPAPDAFGDELASVPVMLVLLAHLGSLAVTDNGLGRQSIVGGASIYPFGHNILLAARGEGLGGVMTTVLCRQEDAVRELLGVPPAFAVAALIALGHPVRQISRLRRRPVEEFTSVDRFNGSLQGGV
ncbi:MAG TPA: nitroreductase family protein [Acidimicrobiales bacterium]|nr:nitroreductase family protein [Acidimicrobiales bacterium]